MKIVVARAGWYVSPSALKEACQSLEIRLQVFIRYTAGRQTLASHRVSGLCQTSHRIALSQDLTRTDANNALWHELAHAVQAERWSEFTGRPIHRFYLESYRHARGAYGASYRENIYEIEARKTADQNSDIWIVRAAK